MEKFLEILMFLIELIVVANIVWLGYSVLDSGLQSGYWYLIVLSILFDGICAVMVSLIVEYEYKAYLKKRGKNGRG